MDFVHVWYDDRYRSKGLFNNTPAHVHDLKVKVKNLEILYEGVSGARIFQNNMLDLIHIWNINRDRSKVLFIIAPTHTYDLMVKVTDLEILYLISDNVKFMTTNDQTTAQEILLRA